MAAGSTSQGQQLCRAIAVRGQAAPGLRCGGGGRRRDLGRAPLSSTALRGSVPIGLQEPAQHNRRRSERLSCFLFLETQCGLCPWARGEGRVSVLPCPCQSRLALEKCSRHTQPDFSEHPAQTAGLSLVFTRTDVMGRGSQRPAHLPPAQRPCWASFSAGLVCTELFSSWQGTRLPVLALGKRLGSGV